MSEFIKFADIGLARKHIGLLWKDEKRGYILKLLSIPNVFLIPLITYASLVRRIFDLLTLFPKRFPFGCRCKNGSTQEKSMIKVGVKVWPDSARSNVVIWKITELLSGFFVAFMALLTLANNIFAWLEKLIIHYTQLIIPNGSALNIQL